MIQPGQPKTYTVTITRTTAPLAQYAFGSLTWETRATARSHSVRSNIAVKPVALAAPAEARGHRRYRRLDRDHGDPGLHRHPQRGTAWAGGGLRHDLVPDRDEHQLQPGQPAGGCGGAEGDHHGAGRQPLARFATFDADYPAGTDLDLFVYRAGTNVPRRPERRRYGRGDRHPDRGAGYDVYVVQFALAGGATSQTVKEHAFVVPTSASSLTTSPASQSVTTSVPATVNANWSGLTAGSMYLGVVDFNDGTGTVGSTILTVRT